MGGVLILCRRRTMLKAAFRLFCSGLFAPLSILVATAAPGPGIQQVTWAAGEVGHEVFTFSNSIEGAQPTMSDFHWGYLVIEAANSLDGTHQGKASWQDNSKPRS